MNRIILIGNGFDLAHGLRTSYADFIADYWAKTIEKLRGEHILFYRDENLTIKAIPEYHQKISDIIHKKHVPVPTFKHLASCINGSPFLENKNIFNNKLLEIISNKPDDRRWVDIEEDYYNLLKSRINTPDEIVSINRDLEQIRKLLETYLSKEHNRVKDVIRDLPIGERIREIVISEVSDDDLSQSYIHASSDKEKLKPLESVLFLNFNYTDTINLYLDDHEDIEFEHIHIHGELNNSDNKMIFGYGDELDEDYRQLERTKNNDVLENIKSIHYFDTDNYRRLLDYIYDEPYQVFIFGHSCGNSDRTLLNTLFEHENCVAIKPYFYQIDKDKDNYSDIVRNISRNFNSTNKAMMRDRVIDRTHCEPLVPLAMQETIQAKTDNLSS